MNIMMETLIDRISIISIILYIDRISYIDNIYYRLKDISLMKFREDEIVLL